MKLSLQRGTKVTSGAKFAVLFNEISMQISHSLLTCVMCGGSGQRSEGVHVIHLSLFAHTAHNLTTAGGPCPPSCADAHGSLPQEQMAPCWRPKTFTLYVLSSSILTKYLQR